MRPRVQTSLREMAAPLFREEIWRIGHLLSRKGLLEAACQMRDVANDVDGEGEAALRAKEILDRLYLQECFIDEALWNDLNEKLHPERKVYESIGMSLFKYPRD